MDFFQWNDRGRRKYTAKLALIALLRLRVWHARTFTIVYKLIQRFFVEITAVACTDRMSIKKFSGRGEDIIKIKLIVERVQSVFAGKTSAQQLSLLTDLVDCLIFKKRYLVSSTNL
jgi:hypothetical protein